MGLMIVQSLALG